METIWKKDNEMVQESNKFIYNVSLHVYEPNQYTLMESRSFRCNVEISKFIKKQWFKFKTFKIEKVTELTHAPRKWLNNNGYFETEVLNKKELNKIKNESKQKNNNSVNTSN